MDEGQAIFLRLAIALAIGLVIGLERGWHGRDRQEGERIAGLRTYGLIGLLGGASVAIVPQTGAILPASVLIALSVAVIVAYKLRSTEGSDAGMTSVVATLLTFILGGLAAAGYESAAAAAAVIAALLLNYKSQLHRRVAELDARELRAALHLLLISVVALPLLPDKGYGPWQALNPYTIWWMVVLIALISFGGYFAIRIGGMRKGILFTSLFGGLASSTAITLHFARVARSKPPLAGHLAAGMLIACGTMFPRMLLVASLINPALFGPMLPPVIVMAVIVYLPAIFFWRTSETESEDLSTPLRNPLELTPAVSFGALLAVIMLLGRALQNNFGDTGVYALAVASGISDVDAITLSLARMSDQTLAAWSATFGIVIAAATNSVTKAGLAIAIGGGALGKRVGVPLVAAAAGGALTAWALLP